MTPSSRTRRLTLSLVLGLASCGGGGGPVPIEQWGTRWVATYCAKLFECCNAAEIMDAFDPAPANQAECRALFEGFIDTEDLESLVAQGTVIYHADRVGACLEATGALACSELIGGDAFDCPGMTSGTIAPAQACADDRECTGPPGTVACEQDVCTPLPRVGEPCAYSCVDGAYCGSGDLCAAEQPDGEPCRSERECASRHCEVAGSAGTCQPSQPAGTCDGA